MARYLSNNGHHCSLRVSMQDSCDYMSKKYPQTPDLFMIMRYRDSCGPDPLGGKLKLVQLVYYAGRTELFHDAEPDG